MSDNIYKQNVYSYKLKMWHIKGTVGQEEESCVQVYSRMKKVRFEKREFSMPLNNELKGHGVFGIVAIDEDGFERHIGETKDRYQILQPLEYCQIYDEAVGKPCETLGFLGSHGEKMFITSKLPEIDIYGDVMEMYQLLSVGFDGLYGEHQYVTRVRVVCENTQNQAISDANQTNNYGRGSLYRGRHNNLNHVRDLKAWLKYVQVQSEEMVGLTKNLFCKMESTPMTVDEAFGLTKVIYPDPEPLPAFLPDELRGEKQEKIDEKTEKASESRDLVMGLFQGDGIAITPTAYGLYNSVIEAENHHRKSKKDTTYSILLGNRQQTMENALSVIGNWTQSK